MWDFPKKPDDQFKKFVYEHFSRIGKAFSSPHRLVIMNILCQGEHTVDALAQYSGLSIANVSRHLQVLKSAKLVRVRRSGKNIKYIIADDETSDFFTRFKDFASGRLAEIRIALQEISKSPSRLQAVTLNELKKKVMDEGVLVVDVRPEEEFEHAHIPGALSLPLSTLKSHLREIPKNKSIVAYCRGWFCILADQAVELLLQEGFDARRAEPGIVEWKMEGLPVEKS